MKHWKLIVLVFGTICLMVLVIVSFIGTILLIIKLLT